MAINTYEIETEGEGLAGFLIEIEYEYDPGSPGSYDEPPEVDTLNIINIKCTIPRIGDQYRLERFLTRYEREGGGRYNPADDQ